MMAFQLSKRCTLLLGLGLIFSFGCGGDDDSSTTTSFSYTVSGAATETRSGTAARFGQGNGQWFITLTADNVSEVLTIDLVGASIDAGTYLVNPILVNGQPQTIMDGDVFAELGLGSTTAGNRRNFSTNAAAGGSLTITSSSADELRGSFSIGMDELLGGGGPLPSILVVGDFTARR